MPAAGKGPAGPIAVTNYGVERAILTRLPHGALTARCAHRSYGKNPHPPPCPLPSREGGGVGLSLPSTEVQTGERRDGQAWHCKRGDLCIFTGIISPFSKWEIWDINRRHLTSPSLGQEGTDSPVFHPLFPLTIRARSNKIFSSKACADAQVAQSVEQRTENPRVGGSIPSLGTTYFLFRKKESK